MLADEITSDLRAIRAQAVSDAQSGHHPVSKALVSKGINYGLISANSDGTVDASQVKGVDPDLRVRPFFLHGGTISMREFVVGALQNEMGLQAVDPELMAAHNGGRFVTPSGMVLDGSLDQVEGPPTDNPAADPDGDGIANEIPPASSITLNFICSTTSSPPPTSRPMKQRRAGSLPANRLCAPHL